MAPLDHAITALDVLGSVVQAVPVVGENLKSAIEIAKKICEMAKVSVRLSIPCTNDSRIAPSGCSRLSQILSRRPARRR
jgi:hypothetical protein